MGLLDNLLCNEGECFLGNGLQEVIYQRALAIEMNKAGLTFAREQEIPMALTAIEDVHLLQGLSHLVTYKLDKGLLINFGAKSIEVKGVKASKK